MTALAIDPGVRTGWARSDGSTGALDLSAYADHGQALAVWCDWLDAELTARPPAFVAIERAFLSRGGAAADLTKGLIGVAHMMAFSHAVSRCEHAADQVRDWLFGARRTWRAIKQDAPSKAAGVRRLDASIRREVEARGFRVADEHAGDAAALLSFVERRAVRAGLERAA